MVERVEKYVEITYHITSNCNLRCTYCYQNHCDSKQVIDIEDAKKAIDCIIDRKLGKETKFDRLVRDDFEQVVLYFIGGETTLYMPIINGICDYFFSQCIKYKLYDLMAKSFITVDTNGTTYFNADVQDFIKKYKHKLLFSITIDGTRECFDKCRKDKNGNSVFDKIEKAVKQHLIDFGRPTDTKVTLSEDNVSYFYESCKYLYSLGFSHIKHSVDINYQPTEEFLKEYRTQLLKVIEWIKVGNIPLTLDILELPYLPEKRFCTCGLDQKVGFAIDWNGDIYNCFRFCEDSQRDKKMPVGNIREGITNTFIIEEILKGDCRNYKKECFDCDCASGCCVCPADSYYINGSVQIPYQRCKLTKLEAEMARIYKTKLYPKIN